MAEVVLRSASPSTAAQHALDGLRSIIVEGELRPGQRIVQDALAERLGTSVAPVREALRLLEREGQVTYRPRRGYCVTELSVDDLEEVYELRQLLEERAVRLALPTLDDRSYELLAAAAEECAAAGRVADVPTELDANRRFHFALMEAPAKPNLLRLIRMLWDSTEAYRALYHKSQAEREIAAQAHQRILAAVRRGDADDVVAELDAHRSRALEVLREILSS